MVLVGGGIEMGQIYEFYSNRNYEACLGLVNHLRKSGSILSTEDSLVEALCFYRLGDFNAALPKFRNVYESAEDNEIRVKSLLNMSMISIRKRDFEYATLCFQELRIIEPNHYMAGYWYELNALFPNVLNGLDSAVKAYSGVEGRYKKIQFQFILDALAKFARRIDFLAMFWEKIDEVHISANLAVSLFDYYIDSDIKKAKSIASLLASQSSTPASKVLLDYMNLKLHMKTSNELQSQLELANRIVSGLKSNAIQYSEPIVKLCSDVFRSCETTDHVLVPTRFGMVGISKAINELRDRIDRYARLDAPVLIHGESGTGKELTARALHEASLRREEPFIVVNCPAIPDHLFESELFGHVAGSFTGADHDHEGKIGLAADGVLFLDEVGDLNPAVQAKLLRFLESGEYQRIGEKKLRQSRARVLAASHKDLANRETFRHDLHQRLKRLELVLPPLSERRDDVRYLARHRVRELNLKDGLGWKRLSKAAEQLLGELDYPGNVRELFNVVDHAWHEAVQEIGEAEIRHAWSQLREHLDPQGMASRDRRKESSSDVAVVFQSGAGWSFDFDAAPTSLKTLQEQVSASVIQKGLDHFDGDIEKVAEYFQISRRSVYRYLERGRRDDGLAGHDDDASV